MKCKKWFHYMMTAGLLVTGSTLFATITVNVYNKTGDKVYLYLDNHSVTNLSNDLIDKKFYGVSTSDKPFTFSMSAIDSGNLLFVIPDETSTIHTGTTTKPTSTGKSIDGFIEFSYIPGPGAMTYWDVSNVDNLGLLCGIQLTDLSRDNNIQKFGYNKPQTDFLSELLTATNLTTSSSAYTQTVSRDTPPKIYYSLKGPTICPDAYESFYTPYLTNLENARTPVTFTTDDLSANTVFIPDSHKTKWVATEFTGHFSPPTNMTGPDGELIKNVVLHLSAQVKSAATGEEKPVDIYITNSALNAKNILKGNSGGGVWVYADKSICDTPVNPNVSLNWVGVDAAHTTLFQAWLVSVQSRGLICALNCGEISDTGKPYNNMDPSTWSSECQKLYNNPYNNYIVNNSDSYGMAYSDAAHSKVQFLTTDDVVADLYIFSPTDPATAAYYTKPVPMTKYQLEVTSGTGCSLGTVSYNGWKATDTNGAYTSTPMPIASGWNKLEFNGGENWIWIKIISPTEYYVSGGTDCFTQNAPTAASVNLSATLNTPASKSTIFTLAIPAYCSWNSNKQSNPTPPSN